MDSEQSLRCLEELGLAFLFAQHYHPAMARVAAVRRQVPGPTIYNLLGPLINPARAQTMLLGVYKPEVVPLVTETLRALGSTRSFVFHSCGLDELSPLGPAEGLLVEGNEIHHLRIDPQELGLARCELEELRGAESGIRSPPPRRPPHARRGIPRGAHRRSPGPRRQAQHLYRGAAPAMIVKICGIQDPEDARLAAEHGADYIGLIAANGYKRTVSPGQAKEIAQAAVSAGIGKPSSRSTRYPSWWPEASTRTTPWKP